jgi:hypothetical protein
MRILLTTPQFPPDGITAADRYTKLLAAELAGAGDTVSVLTRRPAAQIQEPYLERERLQQGVALYRLVGGTADWTNCLVHHARLEQLFKAVLVETDAEVVHFSHLAHLSPRSVELAQRLGAAVVHGIHDFFVSCPLGNLQKSSGESCAGPQGGQECARTCFAHEGASAGLRWGVRTMYFRRLLAAADFVICPSRFVVHHLEAFGAQPARIRVIPPPLRLARDGVPAERRSWPARRGALNLAFLGPVVPHTALHVLLEALRHVRLPVDLFVHGAMPNVDYSTRVREQARRLVGVSTHWHGAGHAGDAAGSLPDVDCVICPWLAPATDCLGPRAALAAGIPLIVSRIGGLPELVAEGENGFTFSTDQPGALIQLIRRLAVEDGLLDRLHLGAGKTRIMSPGEHAGAVRELYGLAIANKERQHPPGDGDRSESDFLHEAMIDLGFAH